MTELRRFIFDDMPVRGVLVRLTDAWQEILRRRAAHAEHQAYPSPVAELLGEMTAAAVLMQANVKFDGTLVFQIFGDGPVKLVVAEVRSDLTLRSTATVVGEVTADATFAAMVNAQQGGRCAITLDANHKHPGQQAYQGVVPLVDSMGEGLTSLRQALEHYMMQSEQLATTLVLAANMQVAAGLLIQRMPVQGVANLAGRGKTGPLDMEAMDEHFNRIRLLASSLKREELLTLNSDTLLRRLFWEEPLQEFVPAVSQPLPRFSCVCSRERVQKMIHGLGELESREIIEERSVVEVGCEFCAAQYRFDAVDVAHIFNNPMPSDTAGGADQLH